MQCQKGVCLTWHGFPHNCSHLKRGVFAVHYMTGHTRNVPVANHPMHSYITVAPGDILAGPHFQVVYT